MVWHEGAFHRRRAHVRAVALLSVIGVPWVASCAPATTSRTTATFAEAPGAAPNYIFPLTSGKYFSNANGPQFQYLMYRPLYWFGRDGQVQLNESLSLARPPQYSADGRSVTIALNNWKWSDGLAVTTRDIQFWQNLVTANRAIWAAYSPGEYPDNVTGMTVTSPTTITFRLNQAYGSYFFTYNELSQITPLPQHVWDKESAGGSVGNYDMTPAGAKAVYKFLDTQSADVSTYATNPLWQIVDGPWKLKSLDSAGNLKMLPNAMYSGPTRARLTEFDEVPFTQDTAEFNVLRAGPSTLNAVDYGYLPAVDVSQRSLVTSLGYTFEPWTGWTIHSISENFANPVSGPLFSQLYFRQAMQELIDQQTFIDRAYNGYAYPTYGPVPLRPVSGYLDAAQRTNPYAYNPNRAVTVLRAHGWKVEPGGTSMCIAPGTGPDQCGPGVRRGAPAAFRIDFGTGLTAVSAMMAQLKTDFALAGVQITLHAAPFSTIFSEDAPCVAGQPCTWDMLLGGWTYGPDFYPTGDELWATGASSNVNSYSDATMDRLIANTETSNDLSALYAYEDYAAMQLPVMWMPTPYYQLNAINSHLHGAVPLDPLLQIYPENWYWS